MVKHLPTMRETQVQSLGWEDTLEKEMATHASTRAWKISWTEECCRLSHFHFHFIDLLMFIESVRRLLFILNR